MTGMKEQCHEQIIIVPITFNVKYHEKLYELVFTDIKTTAYTKAIHCVSHAFSVYVLHTGISLCSMRCDHI